MQGSHDAEERKQLKMAMRADPDAMVDLFLDLKLRIEELEALLKMNSRNSSKPPGSDGYNKPAPKSQRRKSGRKSGGQKGHPGSTLQKVESPDKVEAIKLERRPFTSVELGDSHIVGSVSRQVFDLPPTKLEVTEYRAFVYEVPGAGARVRGEFPQGVSSSTQYGPRFHAYLPGGLPADPLAAHPPDVRGPFRIRRGRRNHRFGQAALRTSWKPRIIATGSPSNSVESTGFSWRESLKGSWYGHFDMVNSSRGLGSLIVK